jgi:hypothetical protein
VLTAKRLEATQAVIVSKWNFFDQSNTSIGLQGNREMPCIGPLEVYEPRTIPRTRAKAKQLNFSRSVLWSAKILVQNVAILGNTVRMLNRQIPSVSNHMQSNEMLRNSLRLELEIRCRR